MRSDERPTTNDRRRWFARQSPVLFWVFVALLLRLALWMQPLHQLANDEIEYVTVARDLLAGRGWTFYEQYHWLRAPLYPLFLAGSLWLSGGNLWLAALPNIALSVATVPLAALLARELAGPSRPFASVIAAAITAILWTLATFASLYMGETLFTFLFTSALVLLLRWQRTRRLGSLVIAGSALGLAILTRSVPLAFLPVVALWIALQPEEMQHATRGTRPAFLASRVSPLAALLFVACCLLIIAPWTVRNCVAYGRCIPVETGLSYNIWAFNEPLEDEATIFRTLEAIPNPAERADYATAKGMERLRADPSIVWRKLWPNWTYLWRVNPIIEDRFLLRTYYADPPPVVFLAALLFDDALMLLITLAGVLGLARAPNRWAALLCVGWLLYIFVTTALTHGEGRYRHFLFPVLIPCAAILLIDLWHWLRRGDRLGGLRVTPSVLAATLLGALLLFTIGETYPWHWAFDGFRRSGWLLAGDVAWRAGNLAGAQNAYRNALAAEERPDAWVRLGDTQRAGYDVEGALDSYRAASALAPAYIVPGLRRGDLLRALGRDAEARAVFDVPYADPQQVIDWAWSDLDPLPTRRIEVGDGLDLGYVAGVYPAEEQGGRRARWTNGRALLRLARPSSGYVWLRLAAPRPDGQPVPLDLCTGDHCASILLDATWRTYRVLLPPLPSEEYLLELRSDTFTAPDGRRLGVLLDEAGD